MRPRSSHAMQHFTPVYLHAQTTADAGDTYTWQIMLILIMEKLKYP